MKARVAVLGSTGMLGHIVAREFKADPHFATTVYNREFPGSTHYINGCLPTTLANLRDVDYVINCIGLIKQQNVTDRRLWYSTNTVFPWLLQQRCDQILAQLIHISTDCVFSGEIGNYSEADAHDATDDYGLSKSCGEPNGAMVLRTSIIGRELRGGLSLLEWAIASRDQHINGYTNHVWNGLTTLEYANVCKRIIINNLYKLGTYHIHSNAVTKFELLGMINTAWDLNLTIEPTVTPVKCDRSLVTVKSLNTQLNVPSVNQMIEQLRRASS